MQRRRSHGAGDCQSKRQRGWWRKRGDEPGLDAHMTEAAAGPASDHDGDARGGDGPAGRDDLNNSHSDATVSGDSYTMFYSYLTVDSDTETLMNHSSDMAASSNLVATAAESEPTVRLRRLPVPSTRMQRLTVWWTDATQTLRRAAL